MEKSLLVIDLKEFYILDNKVPSRYETWNWEGDESILPYKWIELIQKAKIELNSDNIKQYLKENYYDNDKFNKQLFFFITHRSEVAGCVYYNLLNNTIEYFLINLKHLNKGVEEALISLINRKIQENDDFKKELTNLNYINLDLKTTNVDLNILNKLGFKNYIN